MYFSTHFAAKVALAAALATQAMALPTTQPPSAVLVVRNAVGQPGFNLEATPAHFRRRSVRIEARDPRVDEEARRNKKKPEASGGICVVGVKSPCNGDTMKRDVDKAAALEARDPRKLSRRRGHDQRAGPQGGKARQQARLDEEARRKKKKPEASGGICVVGVKSPCNGDIMKRDVDETAALEARDPPEAQPQTEP